ncbi:unnamed protein product [Prorocentrum cordatum]|uniref:SIS domain-containing protein n=1 Tax=Prorocentrum cordatum TaxID=2364126 RepID=A0ABN9QJB6_9DINO|nr:unnamed protein product [Polarella glacialis]
MQAPLFNRSLPTEGSTGMLSDIRDTPEVIKRVLATYLKAPPSGEGSADFPSLRQPLPEGHGLAGRTPMEVMAACNPPEGGSFNNKFVIIGCGTSNHAALVAEYLIEHIARIPVEVQYASEYRYRKPLVRPGDVLFVVSNSGETSDAVESLRLVRKCTNGQKVLIIGVVNEADSTIAKESDAFISVLAGKEMGVASTKVFSSTILTFTLLAIALGECTKNFTEAHKTALLEAVRALPGSVQEVLDRDTKIFKSHESRLEIGECVLWDIACQNVLANNFIFLGRGFCFPVALEGAMKIKELAYIHAEGYPAAEMKHGPIALIDQFMSVVVIAPKCDPSYEKIKSNIEETKARSGNIIAITEYQNDDLETLCQHVIKTPPAHEYTMPLLAVIEMQLLACMMGMLRGNEVDQPRGLQKTITGQVRS